MVVLIVAHPYPDRSRANRRLLDEVRGIPGVDLRSLYDLYPGFDIDVQAEQAALTRARAVIWQHPVQWYTVPGLLKHWFDKVLARGWAYGDGGKALHGKRCLWVATAGGDEGAYSPSGVHGRSFHEYAPVVEQTARFCGMSWEEPIVLRGVHGLSEQALDEHARRYRERVEALLGGAGGES